MGRVIYITTPREWKFERELHLEHKAFVREARILREKGHGVSRNLAGETFYDADGTPIMKTVAGVPVSPYMKYLFERTRDI